MIENRIKERAAKHRAKAKEYYDAQRQALRFDDKNALSALGDKWIAKAEELEWVLELLEKGYF